MGWTIYDDKPRDERAEILNLLTWTTRPYEVLKLSHVGTLWFAAVKFLDGDPGHYTPDEDGSFTWCAIFLTENSPSGWGYKDMSEEMGPAARYCQAPKSLLKLLSPTTSEWALNFRSRCNWVKPKPGETIRTEYPINFGSSQYQVFTKTDQSGIYRTEQGGLVRLSYDDIRGASYV